jgi:hypothetical protein
MQYLAWAIIASITTFVAGRRYTKDQEEEFQGPVFNWSDLDLQGKIKYMLNLPPQKMLVILSISFISLKMLQTTADIYKTSKR